MQHHGWSLPSKLMLRQLHARGTRLTAQYVQAVTHHALVGSRCGRRALKSDRQELYLVKHQVPDLEPLKAHRLTLRYPTTAARISTHAFTLWATLDARSGSCCGRRALRGDLKGL